MKTSHALVFSFVLSVASLSLFVMPLSGNVDLVSAAGGTVTLGASTSQTSVDYNGKPLRGTLLCPAGDIVTAIGEKDASRGDSDTTNDIAIQCAHLNTDGSTSNTTNWITTSDFNQNTRYFAQMPCPTGSVLFGIWQKDEGVVSIGQNQDMLDGVSPGCLPVTSAGLNPNGIQQPYLGNVDLDYVPGNPMTNPRPLANFQCPGGSVITGLAFDMFSSAYPANPTAVDSTSILYCAPITVTQVAPPTCNSNADCGVNALIGNSSCQGNSVFQTFRTWTCNNPGSANATCSFSDNNQQQSVCAENQTCSSGTCNNVNITCSTNSQCGTNVLTGSPFCNGNAIYQNFRTYTCNNPGTANSNCSFSDSNQLQNNCSANQTCSGGTCNDVNITCSTNAQCGTNVLVGNPYCNGNSVYQNYKTFTCNNPGTQYSSCSDSTAPQLQNNCNVNQVCSGGSCNANLVATCTASPNPASPNQPVTFTSSVTGGTGTYSYAWAGFCNGFSQNCTNAFSQPNNYIAFLTVASGNQQSSTACLVSVNQTCTPNASLRCVGNTVYNFDSCGNQGSVEQACGENQTCSNGACNNVNITCSNNSQCGTNGLVGSPVCQGNSVYQNYRTYTCNYPGTANSNCSFSDNNQLQSTCADGQTCSGGSCSNNNPNLVVSCNAAPNPANTNQNVNFTSTVSGGTGSYTYQWSTGCSGFSQNCSNSFATTGAHTAFLHVASGNQTQDTSCSVTVNQACTPNATQQCVGNTAYNFDSCGNQGSLIENCSTSYKVCSSGSCIPVTCSTNSQCGTNGLTGSPVCQGNSIYQNYRTFTCNNPGTANSTCSFSDVNQLQSTCAENQTCSGGTCHNVNITCSTNAQCGTNTLVGSPYCNGNSVYQNYKTFTCNNPGTANSSCSDSTAPQLQTNCAENQACSDGSCHNNSGLVISCSASPNPANVNQSVNFTSTATGGTGNYTYQWSTGCSGFLQNCSNSFGAAGVHTAFLHVTSGNQTQDTSCSVNVNQSCTPNATHQCVGNTVYNFDSCGNQGSVVQTCNENQTCSDGTCNNVNYACNINSDCGTNGFIGSPICQGNAVYQNYQTFTCSNPSTPNATCSNYVSLQLQQVCANGQTCSGGSCSTNDDNGFNHRGPGFWQTHTYFTLRTFNGSGMFVGVDVNVGPGTHKGIIPSVSEIFGAFYSSIPKTTGGSQRSQVDRDRMILLPHLITAKLNCAAFGCPASIHAGIVQADANYANGSDSAIQGSISLLNGYNGNNGGNIGAGSATPQISQTLADTAFWDMP